MKKNNTMIPLLGSHHLILFLTGAKESIYCIEIKLNCRTLQQYNVFVIPAPNYAHHEGELKNPSVLVH